ncbi:hypothetical protein ENUP19_0319G0017 [Entamoeba nuttalli]|uniref:Structure-specific endonuclease subunit SLX1 homolog n=2 Tax=Entamoeba nuttalli TaxID=412467 RepID=K2G5A0_ENTNP|nr:GIY-YIG catalytic domain containing protein [Entamoeba nuttalli P19]EKE37506.1 GIY-YIG catalytic domain containing protein [Entamoeba nuttalli P19]|eukprot:XP_008860164.1 GIY-YIG catalytic domain containing protein [Entamoeba nuttalli P19]
MEKNISSMKFCVYLLTSINPGFKYHTYIGKTTCPPRRIKQHNGIISGGAFKTEAKRPWEMVIVVHSFPTQTKVLQFEWDWQHPEKGRRVRQAFDNMKGKHCGTMFSLQYKIRLLAEILQMPSYCKLPLSVYITTHRYDNFLNDCPPLPKQITVEYGDLNDIMKCVGIARIDRKEKTKIKHDNIFDNLHGTSQSQLSQLIEDFHLDDKTSQEVTLTEEQKKIQMQKELKEIQNTSSNCFICHQRIKLDQRIVKCLYKCGMKAHLCCLGKMFSENTHTLIPTTGNCPKCQREIRWGDIIKVLKNKTIESF